MFITVLSYSQQDTIKYRTSEITVEGIRADNDVPITKTDIDTSTINFYNFGQEIPLFLERTPNVFSISENGLYTGYTHMRLRGIDQTRINVTLNGIPLNEPEDQGVYFCNYVNFLSNIKDIQIQRGVGSTSNGVASYIGSINFTTPLSLSRKLDLSLGYGAFNTNQFNLGYSSSIYNNLSLYTRISYNKSDGYRYNSFNDSYSIFINGTYFQNNSSLSLISFYGNAKNGMVYLPSALSEIEKDSRHNPLKPYEQDNFKYWFNTMQYTNSISNNLSLTTSVYYIHLNGWYNVNFEDGFVPDFNLNSSFIGFINNVSYTEDNCTVDAGIHFYDYIREHFSNEFDYKNKGNKREISLFGKFDYRYGQLNFFTDVQFRLNRFEYYKDKKVVSTFNPISYTFLNFRGGINYNITDDLNTYVSFGTTKREPTRNDMFAGADNIDDSLVINNNLNDFSKVKPESVYDLEAGIIYNSDKITLKGNIFLMEFNNEIAPIGEFSYIGLPLRENVKSSYRRGIELELEYDIEEYLKYSQTVSFMKSNIQKYKDLTNVVPLLSPEWISNSSLVIHTDAFAFGINGRYLGESHLDNENTMVNPSSFIFNILSKYNFNNGFEINLNVNNLFNTRYYTSGTAGIDEPFYFIGAERNYYLIIKFNL